MYILIYIYIHIHIYFHIFPVHTYFHEEKNLENSVFFLKQFLDMRLLRRIDNYKTYIIS